MTNSSAPARVCPIWYDPANNTLRWTEWTWCVPRQKCDRERRKPMCWHCGKKKLIFEVNCDCSRVGSSCHFLLEHALTQVLSCCDVSALWFDCLRVLARLCLSYAVETTNDQWLVVSCVEIVVGTTPGRGEVYGRRYDRTRPRKPT